MLRSDLCDFSDVHIIVKGDITVTNPNNAKRNKAVVFKNNAPFISCISKINGIKIANTEDLNVVMLMYNLLEYSKNYRKTTGSLWNYYRDHQVILFQLILNLSNIKQALQGILLIIMLMTMMIVMMQIKLVKRKLKLLFH